MLGWLFGKKARTDDNTCVVCNSTDLTTLAPEAYRCNACGHEGGDGYAAWQDMQTRARYDDWSVAQLREHAAAQLNEVRATLVGAPSLNDGAGPPTASLGSVQVSIDLGTNAQDEAARRAWVRSERTRLVEEARYGLHRASLTLDALADKGVSEAAGARDSAKNPPEELDDVVRSIEAALRGISP